MKHHLVSRQFFLSIKLHSGLKIRKKVQFGEAVLFVPTAKINDSFRRPLVDQRTASFEIFKKMILSFEVLLIVNTLFIIVLFFDF